MLAKLFKQILRKKLIAGISLILIVAGGYFGYQSLIKKNDETRYVTAAVEKGTLIVSIPGSGQVSASDQIDIKPKVSGDVVYVGVKNGQEVKAGALLVQIDSRDAQKALRDAKTSLETAKLELEELLQPVDLYSLMQAENALIQVSDNLTKLKFAQESEYHDTLDAIQKAEDDLEKIYEDAFNTVTNAFLDLPTLITGLKDMLYSYEIAKSEIVVSNYSWNITALINSADHNDRYELQKFINSAEDDYKIGNTKDNTILELYNSDKMNKLRELFKAGKFEQIPFCKDCR